MNHDSITVTPATIVIGELLILTEAAVLQLQRQWIKHECQGGARLSTEDTKDGCAGMRYVFEWANTVNPDDIALPINHAGDTLHVYIDKTSLPFLKGTCIDYVKQGINATFQFTNPNAVGTCGCGESFTTTTPKSAC